MEDQPFPLHHDQFEVQHIDEHQIGPYTQIIEYLDCFVAIEVPQDGEIQVWLVSHMDDTEVAGVVAKYASEQDDDEAEDVSGVEGEYWQDENEATDHTIDHTDYCHYRGEGFLLSHVDQLL